MSATEARDVGPELEGWTRRFTAIGARLDEAAELYRGLGFEIRLEPAEPQAEAAPDASGCAQCFVMTLARTIYTRPLSADADELATER
ncbi:MAG: hypothetical protein KGO05_05865 [Chloroflexota bacterium]|nr:hypothetical protein [Chloroflexota bacterium]